MTAELAARVVAKYTESGVTVATAESLTGGMIAASITDVPGSSAVLVGGVVAYATGVKSSVLGVDGALLEREGPVHAEVALAMADGVARLMGADVGVACTGVAGPDSQGGHWPGTVFVAVVGPDGRRVDRLDLHGDRGQVRAATVMHALTMLLG